MSRSSRRIPRGSVEPYAERLTLDTADGNRLHGVRLPPTARPSGTLILGFGFVGWVFYYAGTTIAAQFEALRLTVEAQVMRAYAWAADHGLVPEGSSDTVVQQLFGSLGRVTSADESYAEVRLPDEDE